MHSIKRYLFCQLCSQSPSRSQHRASSLNNISGIAGKGLFGLDVESNFQYHAWSFSKATRLVLWVMFPLALRLCERIVQVLTRLGECEGSPEPLLLTYAITVLFPRRDVYVVSFLTDWVRITLSCLLCMYIFCLFVKQWCLYHCRNLITIFITNTGADRPVQTVYT